MNPQTGNSERHENNTKSRVGNGRASQGGQSEDRSFLGCLPEEWLLLTLGWPSHGTRISRCAVTLEIWLLRWTLYRVLPQMNVGYMGSSTMIPCYHPWQCWETQSTSGLCRHPVRSTWAHHGRCWQAPSWWKRTVLKGTTDSFFSALALIFFTASLHWLQHSWGANRRDRADPALDLALPGTWHMCLRHLPSVDQAKNRTSERTNISSSSWQFRLLSDKGPRQSFQQRTTSQENYTKVFGVRSPYFVVAALANLVYDRLCETIPFILIVVTSEPIR